MEPVLRATGGGECVSYIAAALVARVCLGMFIQASEIRSRNGRASGCQGAAHAKAHIGHGEKSKGSMTASEWSRL